MHVDVIASVENRKKQQHSKTNEITQQYEIVIASNVTNWNRLSNIRSFHWRTAILSNKQCLSTS